MKMHELYDKPRHLQSCAGSTLMCLGVHGAVMGACEYALIAH